MKYGILLFVKSDNIGDDIQTYAGLKYLPQVDYVVDRENLDSFLPNNKEKVAVIMNSWMLYNKYNWPLSPYLNPLFISVHFTDVDRGYNMHYRHLSGYGIEYLKKYKVGCRDEHTEKLLKDLNVDSYLSGCLTLTIDKFKDIKKENYICAVDIEEKIIDKIKKLTQKEIKVITHDINSDENSSLTFKKRMKNVEELLKTYQGASLVVTSRLHCALPALALGTPVLLIYHNWAKERVETFLEFMNHCCEDELLNGTYKFNFDNPPKNDEGNLLKFKRNLEKTCRNFIKKCNKTKNDINSLPDINFYKHYVVDQGQFQKNILIESINELKRNLIEISETHNNLLNDVNNANNKLNEVSQETKVLYDELYVKNNELQGIYNSRVWKLASIYYAAKKISRRIYKKSISLIKSKINNGFLKVNNIEINKNMIQYNYQVEGKIKKYFNLDNKMPIEYDEDISKVPNGVLIIPLITNILPIIWFNNATLYVDEIDKTFYESIPNILKGYKNMFPHIKLRGKIVAKKIISYNHQNLNKSIMFFSGGVDSFSTLISQIKEKPELLTIWGSDIDITNQEGWNTVKDFVQNIGKKFDLQNIFIKSDFRKNINTDELNKDYADIIKDNWWHDIQHGIGLIGHAAIYSYLHKLRTVYIPGTYCDKDVNVVCASYPTIDEAVAFGNTKIIHEGFNLSRQMKVKNIVEYSDRKKIKLNLRVCWKSLKGDNCCICEKCYRTIMSILSFGRNPKDYGFNFTDKDYLKIKSDLIKEDFIEQVTIRLWKDIQKEFIKNKKKWSKDKRVNWIFDIDFDNLLIK